MANGSHSGNCLSHHRAAPPGHHLKWSTVISQLPVNDVENIRLNMGSGQNDKRRKNFCVASTAMLVNEIADCEATKFVSVTQGDDIRLVVLCNV